MDSNLLTSLLVNVSNDSDEELGKLFMEGKHMEDIFRFWLLSYNIKFGMSKIGVGKLNKKLKWKM